MLYIKVTRLVLSNNECDMPIADAAVSSEVILGVFLSHGSASSVTDDLHINSVWAELCGPGETERERKWKGKGRWGTAFLCVSYYWRHMAHWIEILTMPYVLVLNGFTYLRFFNSYNVHNLCSFIYNILLNWIPGNKHQHNIFINFIWYRLTYDFIRNDLTVIAAIYWLTEQSFSASWGFKLAMLSEIFTLMYLRVMGVWVTLLSWSVPSSSTHHFLFFFYFRINKTWQKG